MRTQQGAATITSSKRIGGTHRVYNFEVEATHQYFVGETRTLSHNASCTQPRNAKGQFMSPSNGPHAPPGAETERQVWDELQQTIKGQEGFKLVKGRVYAKDTAGNVRVYDGALVDPNLGTIGLEIKSGTGRLTGEQRTFDANVTPSTPATAYGQSKGLPPITRTCTIRRPKE